jgi:SAM-dependent methyltransferase
LHPRVRALLEIGVALQRERAELRASFPLDDRERAAAYWHWLHWHGTNPDHCRHADAIRELTWPLPPRHLTGRVVGEGTSEIDFLRGGLTDWRRVRDCLVRGGFEFDGGAEVLDFGVGCGRILRYFGLDAATCRFVGADVDAEAIEWCRESLDFARFEALPFVPPTSLAEHRFSAVYGFSVFSHLREAHHLAWLRELHRVTRPGAVLVLTVMGLHCARLVRDGALPLPHPAPEAMRAAFPRLEAGELLYFPYERLEFRHEANRAHFAEWDLMAYGSTYLAEPYVRRHWTEWFDVVAYDLAPDGWQDYVTLRRRELSTTRSPSASTAASSPRSPTPPSPAPPAGSTARW